MPNNSLLGMGVCAERGKPRQMSSWVERSWGYLSAMMRSGFTALPPAGYRRTGRGSRIAGPVRTSFSMSLSEGCVMSADRGEEPRSPSVPPSEPPSPRTRASRLGHGASQKQTTQRAVGLHLLVLVLVGTAVLVLALAGYDPYAAILLISAIAFAAWEITNRIQKSTGHSDADDRLAPDPETGNGGDEQAG